jgi:hypothetical protein
MRIASLLVLGGLAASPMARADGTIHGFVWRGHDQLDGRVTDTAGHALPGAQVHVVADGAPERVVATDRDGDYRVKVASGVSCLVFVYGDARITSAASSSQVADAAETIEMHETILPAQPPTLHRRPRLPTYSDAAIDHDRWIRAWLLLDVDESGVVTRVKLVDRPGYDLDAAAVLAAFELDLEPARDRANRPVRTQLLWPIDWPAFSWMAEHGDGMMTRMPDAASTLPCKGTTIRPEVERSCAPATVANMLSAPWIARGAR